MASANAIPLKQNPAYILFCKSFQQTKTHLSITNLIFGHPVIETRPHIFPIFLQRAAKKLRSIPPKLKRLTLDINLVRSDPSILYNHLLKDLQHIEHLKIPLCPNYGFHNPSYFDLLLKTLRKLRNLKVLEMIVPRHFEWKEKNSMRYLIKTLSKSAPRLKDVKIIFEDGSGGSLAQGNHKPLLNEWRIQRLAILQSLTLHLPRAAFITFNDENEGKVDLSAFRSFRKLKSLDLSIIESSIQPGPDCKKFIFEAPRAQLFPNLKRFQWSLLNSRWTELEGLQLLGAKLAFAFRVPPEDFTLKFKQIGLLSDPEIMLMGNSFASLTTNLKQLHFVCNELSSKGSENLISVLSAPRISRTQILDLMVLDCKGVNDRYMAKFGQVLSPELKYLRLRFDFIKEKEKGIVGALKNIFGEEEGITDKGISKFGEDLVEKCKNLQCVWIEFGKHEKISDKGVKSLCESLNKIEKLDRVWLKFRLCGEVTGKYAKEILGEKREVQFSLI